MVALIVALLEHPEQHAEVQSCLVDAGHEICFVDSFARAMAILEEHSFDLIVSDVHLENGGTVFDFLKWVKSNPKLEPIPFVLLSLKPSKQAKYLADGVRTAAQTLGAAKYICMDTMDGARLATEVSSLLPPPENLPKSSSSSSSSSSSYERR